MESILTPATSQSPAAPARRSWLKRLAATLGGGLLARAASASPTEVQTGATAFVGEIIMCGFNFPPRGYAMCNGQLLPISQNTALFSLLGTTYGGDGKSTFALPNLQTLIPIGAGQGPGLSLYDLGQTSTTDGLVVTPDQVPAHTHTLPANNVTATTNNPVGAVPAITAGLNVNGEPVAVQAYGSRTATPATMNQAAIATTGAAQIVAQAPYLTINYCIAMQGIFPPRG